MARIRTIKPEFWADEKLGPLPPIDRLVFLGLISLADDCGRLLDNIKQIDAAIFPYTDDSARGSLARLTEMGRIVRGETSSGQRVIQVANWHHQKIERPNLGGSLPPINGYEDERSAYFKRKAVPKWMRLAVFERDKSTCQECGKEDLRSSKSDKYDAGPDLGEVDHRVEAIDGGEPSLDNLVLLCLPCNRRKAGIERRRRNMERTANDAKRLDDASAIAQRSFSDDSPNVQRSFSDISSTRSTTNDQRPTTRTNDQNQSAPRKRAAPKAVAEKQWPLFGQDERARCITAFRKLGAFEPGRVIKAVGPFFRAPEDPAFIPHDKVAFAVEDYCGIIAKGRSSPFASPEDCAKKLGAMARNCVTYEWDALGRLDAQMLAVHGSTKLAA